MKQNPCRHCAFSFEYNGRHYRNVTENCWKCEKIKKHDEYLQAKRKYVPGDTITSIPELLEQKLVIWNGQTKHIEVIKSLQLQSVLMFLNNGSIKKAIKKESEE